MKYCADGGVYYTYNFIEQGVNNGYVSWPWGAKDMQKELRIDPAVRRLP